MPVRLGDRLMSCAEPIRLPSSVVLAVPKGAPIMIGGPPSLDIMAAIFASLRTRFVSDSLHALLSRMKPSRFRNMLHWAVCKLTGHPVDVASGRGLTGFLDAELPGPIPLLIERFYSSAFASRPVSLGYGWESVPRPSCLGRARQSCSFGRGWPRDRVRDLRLPRLCDEAGSRAVRLNRLAAAVSLEGRLLGGQGD